MPIPAGTGIDRRRFLLAAAGGLVSVYGAGRLGLGGQALSEGIAQAATRAELVEPDPGLDLPRRRDRCPVGAGPDRGPDLPQAAPDAGRVPVDGIPFAEDPRLSWGPAAAGVRPAARRRQADRVPGHRLPDPDMSHFTSRHYWEVGAADTRVMTGWLGRYLDQVGHRRQSAPGPVDGLRDEPDAGHRGQPGGGDRPARELLVVAQRRVGRRVLAERSTRPRRSATPSAAPRIRRSPRSPARPPRWGSCAATWRRSRNADGKPQPTPRPVTYPTDGELRLPAAARRAGGDDRGRSAAALRGADARDPVRHPRRPGRDVRPRADQPIADAHRRLPGRPGGPRDRRPRAGARVVGVRPPRAGERLAGHRPRGRRRAHAASAAARAARWSESGRR